MKNQSEKINSKEWMLLILFSFVIILAIVSVYVVISQKSTAQQSAFAYDKKLIAFDEGWELSYEGFDKTTVNLPVVTNAQVNEIVSISKRLPNDVTDGMYLRIRSSNTVMKVYISGEMIYSTQNFSFVQERWNYIELKQSYSNRTLDITFESPYPYYSRVVPNIILCTLPEMILYTSSSAALLMYLGVCIIAMGIITLMLSMINTPMHSSLRRYAYLSIYIIFLGLIIITRAQLARSFDSEYAADYLIFHLCVRICPIIYCMYMYLRVKKQYKNYIFVCVCLCALSFLISMILNYFGLMDYTSSLFAALLCMALSVGLGFYFDVIDKSGASAKYRIVMGVGLSVFTLGCLAEILLRVSTRMKGQYTLLAVAVLIYAAAQSASVTIFSFDIAMEQVRLQKELNDKKIKLMMSQMQPHFIYNTLNTIRGMTLSEPQKAYEMTYNFSNYLKHNISSLKDNDIIPFTQELEHIKAYAAIECERFSGKINVVYDIKCTSFLIPPLSIEPFVENAIKHGIRKRSTSGSVTIATEMYETYYQIIVKDDGVGFDTSLLENEKQTDIGIGIKNAVYRLQILSDAHVEIKSSPGSGCLISIIIPKILSEGDLQ